MFLRVTIFTVVCFTCTSAMKPRGSASGITSSSSFWGRHGTNTQCVVLEDVYAPGDRVRVKSGKMQGEGVIRFCHGDNYYVRGMWKEDDENTWQRRNVRVHVSDLEMVRGIPKQDAAAENPIPKPTPVSPTPTRNPSSRVCEPFVVGEYVDCTAGHSSEGMELCEGDRGKIIKVLDGEIVRCNWMKYLPSIKSVDIPTTIIRRVQAVDAKGKIINCGARVTLHEDQHPGLHGVVVGTVTRVSGCQRCFYCPQDSCRGVRVRWHDKSRDHPQECSRKLYCGADLELTTITINKPFVKNDRVQSESNRDKKGVILFESSNAEHDYRVRWDTGRSEFVKTSDLEREGVSL